MRPALVFALVAVVVALGAPAAAQPAVEAEALFRQGKDFMAQRKYAEACIAFETSQRLDPNVATLMNHADCREKNQQLATAWDLFIAVEHQTRTGLDLASKQLNATATERAAKLGPRLSKLTIKVADTPLGLEILRGDTRLDARAWNQPLSIDGGTYRITARAPGRVEWSATAVVKPEADAQIIEIPELAAAPATDPAAPVARGRSLVLPIVFGGAALALGGTAFGFSRWGDSLYEDAEREPDDARQESLWKSANTRRYLALGFTAAAVGCAGTAIYFALRRGRAESSETRTVRVMPTAASDALGVLVGGAW